MWIGVEANEVVNLLVTLGVLWKIPSIIMGLTFLAIANNLGDFIADRALAQQGNSRMGFTWVLTSLSQRVFTFMNPTCKLQRVAQICHFWFFSAKSHNYKGLTVWLPFKKPMPKHIKIWAQKVMQFFLKSIHFRNFT